MSAYVYLWDIFVCAFHGILSIPAFWLRSIRVCFNLIGIFHFFICFSGCRECGCRYTAPRVGLSRTNQSDRWCALLVGHETWATHTVPTVQFVIFSAGYLFQVFILGLQSCRVDISSSFMGKFTFTFMLILKFFSTKIE